MKEMVKFSCGHIEQKELFGSAAEREKKIAYWGRSCVCSECYRAMQAAEMAEDYEEVVMSYREYKTSEYADCKTKSGSYDAKAKTIIVYVPRR